MTSRPPSRPAATHRAAGTRAAGARTATSVAGRPLTVRTAAALVAAGLLLSGCGSLTGSSGPAQTGTGSANAAAAANHGGGAADGSAQRPRNTAPARALLCEHPRAPLSVRILWIGPPVVVQPASGTGGASGLGAGGAAAESVSVTGTTARSLAEAACALPALRPIPLCPWTMPYHRYQLTFTVAGRVFPVVIVRRNGCPLVTGPGTPRWLRFRKAFLAELGSVVAVARPRQPFNKLPLTGKPIHRISLVSLN